MPDMPKHPPAAPPALEKFNLTLPPEVGELYRVMGEKYGAKWAVAAAGMILFARASDAEREDLIGQIAGARMLGNLPRMVDACLHPVGIKSSGAGAMAGDAAAAAPGSPARPPAASPAPAGARRAARQPR